LSRTFTLSPNDSGSIVYFAEQHGNAATAAARLSTGGLTTRAPRGAEGHEPARFQGRGRSLADDSESAKLPSISLGALGRDHWTCPTNTFQPGPPFGCDFLYLQGKAQGLSAVRRQPGDVKHDRP
jgi:hypothetical protein